MLKFLRTWKLDDIEKRPLVVFCAFLISLCIFTITRKDSRELEAKRNEKEWQDRYIELTIDLLEKNKIIERKDQEIETLRSEKTDSTVRDEVSEPLHNILKP